MWLVASDIKFNSTKSTINRTVFNEMTIKIVSHVQVIFKETFLKSE